MQQVDPKAFHKLSYGLYVVSSIKEGMLNGQIANTVFQISSDPITIAIGINRNNLTNEFIKASGVFSVSVLSKETPLGFIGHFGFKSGREIAKYETIPYRIGINGVPIPKEHCLSSIEAQVISSYEVETHTVFIGKVINAEIVNDAEPMTYAYYFQLKSGSVPKTEAAPASRTDSSAAKQQYSSKYQCTVCGYIYDPAAGDPDSGILPGTAFKDIPDDWVCPICGVGKDQFTAVN